MMLRPYFFVFLICHFN